MKLKLLNGIKSSMKMKITSAVTASMMLASTANAALPKSDNYTSNGDADIISIFKSLIADGYSLAVLSFGAIAALIIAVILVQAISEWRKGQKELSDVATIALVGGIILTGVYVLLNMGSSVLSGS